MITAEESEVVSRAINVLSDKLTSPKARLDMAYPEAALGYLRLHIGNRPVETYAVIYLDARFRMIEYQEIGVGTVNQVSLTPRALVCKALETCARYIVLAHNHPSGDCAPSDADRKATLQIIELLEKFDVGVLEHFVIGRAPGFPAHGILACKEFW